MAKITYLRDWRDQRGSLESIQSIRIGWSERRRHFTLTLTLKDELSEHWLDGLACVVKTDDERCISCKLRWIEVDSSSAIAELVPRWAGQLPSTLAKDDPFLPFASVTLGHATSHKARTLPNGSSKSAFQKRLVTPDDEPPSIA